MHDFVLFDGGVKKLPRVHQYFGIKAAQEHARARKGGIIWHTQGSGKSIVMVLLAKWILENNPNARVAIITDRDELDKQIERVFNDVGEKIKRTNSGRDLMSQLSQANRGCCARWCISLGVAMWTTSRHLLAICKPSPARPWVRCSCSWTSAIARKAEVASGDEGDVAPTPCLSDLPGHRF